MRMYRPEETKKRVIGQMRTVYNATFCVSVILLWKVRARSLSEKFPANMRDAHYQNGRATVA